ncbi:ankyrin [Annulohypoxylon maeteangense]|uniref:ankyrin n=1 Tax=Annulohypoxylon maeteangense TaxID=1927788 RepID=UPI002008DC7D|nr:ankyrin [Annulohypoxylon maeteangense]KAI0889106.1 ankyrin [Annulohypoxylon maeteangense]
MTITLDYLPTEILLIIASQSGYWGRNACAATQYSFASLARTNRRLHYVFNPILWKYNGKWGIHQNFHDAFISAAIWAAMRNRIDILDIAVKYQHDLGSFFEDDPMKVAARSGHDATVSWLLDHGVPLECTPCERIVVDSPFPVSPWPQDHVSPGYSALHSAIICRRESTSILLLSRGAKYQFKTNTNKSAIHLAALNGLPTVIEYLVKTMGINVNQHDQDAMTPLHYAVERPHNTKTIQLLLDLGADKNAVHNFHSPLVRALKKQHLDNAMVLLDAGAKVNPTKDDDEAPLVVCARNFNTLEGPKDQSYQIEVLRKIIANGAALDRSFHKDTALCSAIEQGTAATTYELLRAGADVEAPREKDGMTPFDMLWIIYGKNDNDGYLHCSGDFTDKISYLCLAGARLDTRRHNSKTNTDSRTQLENAIDRCPPGQGWMLENILASATRRNFRDGYINELFETCLQEQRFMQAKILKYHGATSHATNELAFIWAKQIIKDDSEGIDFHSECLSFCLDFLSSQQIETLFETAVVSSWQDGICHALLDRGALSSWKETKEFKHWLHVAVSHRCCTLIRRLVSLGMDVNALDENYNTPMMVALKELEDPMTADLLFELGADPFHPRPDTEYRRSPNTSTEILSPFELALRRDYLIYTRKWWFNTPSESRPTEEFCIPRVLNKGPWYQGYLEFLRNKSDTNLLDRHVKWDLDTIKRPEWRRFRDDEGQNNSLASVMNEAPIPTHLDDLYHLEFWGLAGPL